MNQLHYNTVSPLLLNVLQKLMLADEFKPFRLVGGTALSLHVGHRKSVDIDLFTDALYGTIEFEAIDTFFRRNFQFVDSLKVKIEGMGKAYYVGDNEFESVKVDIFITDHLSKKC